MQINKLSEKQREILSFIKSDDYAIICDGSVRSGKTTIMSMAFLLWAMNNFDRTNFAICGKTVQSAERNVLKPLMEQEALIAAFTMTYKVSTRVLTVKCGNKTNWFYLFGGKDESSYMLIQGITLGGVFFDEVALMPKSFVEQALSRAISFENPKYFFNCNPESPNHYFYKEWIETERPNTRHIHFLLEDNPILTPAMIERTKAMYSGIFYDRYIRGLWVLADGLVYPMFDASCIVDKAPEKGRYFVSIDYGTQNPFSAGLWCMTKDGATRIAEYYYSGRDTSSPKTDEEYYEAVEKMIGKYPVECIVIDPSAASFIACIKRHNRFRVAAANNSVMDGIRTTATYLKQGRLKVCRCCKDAIREFGLYSYDDKASDDKVIKENDHAMDDTRYFCYSIMRRYFPVGSKFQGRNV